MSEDNVDRLTLQLIGLLGMVMKWLAIQLIVLLALPFLWGIMGFGTTFYTCLYTGLYCVYWSHTEKDVRLTKLYKPYLIYLPVTILCGLIWDTVFPSLLMGALLPLYGVFCYIIVVFYRKFRKRWLTNRLKRLAFAAAVVLLLVMVKVVNVSWVSSDFDSEKEELLERRDWLAEKLVTTPQGVINNMTKGIGAQFMGEWALYSCSMFSDALVNLSKLYPETKEENLQYIDRLIQVVSSRELSEYDTMRWGENALTSLQGDKSHMSYLSHLAWMIGGYKSIGGGNKYDELYNDVCEAMDIRLRKSPSFNLETYPGEPIYIPDMLVCIVALHQYSQLNGGKYADTVAKWIDTARKYWCDGQTGLLVSYLDLEGNKMAGAPIKGSYSALNCSYLSMIDEDFAREQYQHLKDNFWYDGLLAGMNEYTDYSPVLAMDIDAGPIIFGLSPSGTAFATGAATYFNDKDVRTDILRTAEIAGCTIHWNGTCHYALANVALVGEAIMLAMRTNKKFK